MSWINGKPSLMVAKSIQAYLPPMEVMSGDQTAPKPAADGTCALSTATAIDRALLLLRRAVADCNYTLDALEAATGKNRAHIHRVLHGERPLTLQFLAALPTDLKARYAQLCAEALGFIVVTPLHGREAVQAV